MPDSQPQPSSPNPTKTATLDLVEKKRDLAVHAAAIQSQLRAIDRALDALEQNARNETIHIELTKDDAAFLMATCWHFAACKPELGEQVRDRINGFGNFIFEAIFTQNSRFARHVMRLGRGEAPTGAGNLAPS